MASLGKLFFQIGANVSEALSGIAKIEKSISNVSRSLGSLGKLTLGAASFAGIANIAKDALVASAQLEKTFLKIKNLTDSSASDLALFKSSIGGISKTLGVSTNDLADGLYNITSAGVSGAKALETLEISAKGAAVGMGTTDEISKALSSTLNAYAGSNLTATKAAEIFFKTTKSGAIDMRELTASMSNVTPLASALGVSLEQVGAFLATASLKGTQASEAVTQLAGIFNAVINPTDEARKILGKIGLSMDELQAKIKTDFRGALLDLEKGFAGSATAMAKFFGRKEPALGFLSVVGDSAGKYGEILQGIEKNTNLLQAATEDAMNSMEGRWNRAVAIWKNALVVLGDILATTTLLALEKPQYLDEAGNIEKVNDALRQQRRETIGLIAEKNNLNNLFNSAKYPALSAPGGAAAGGLVNPSPQQAAGTKKVIDQYSDLRKELEKLFDGNNKTAKSVNTLKTATNSLNESLDYWNKYTTDQVEEQKKLNLLLLDETALSKANTQAIIDNVNAKKAAAAIDARVNAITRDKERTEVSGLGPPEGESIPEIIKGISSRDLERLSNIFETDGLTAYKDELGKVNESMNTSKQIMTEIGQQSAVAFSNLALGLIDGSVAFKDLGRAALDAADQIVKAALATAIAAAISGSLKNPNILVGLALAAVAIALVKRMFKANVPKLASGGLARRPTLAVVGDNPNAASDPEVISPLSKLNALLANQISNLAGILTRSFNQSIQAVFAQPVNTAQSQSLNFRDPFEVTVRGKIEGNDIRLAYDRAASTNSKFQPNYY